MSQATKFLKISDNNRYLWVNSSLFSFSFSACVEPLLFIKDWQLDTIVQESRKWVEHFFSQNIESATLWVPPYFDVSVKRSTIVDMSAFWLNNKNGEEYKNIMVNQSSLSSNVKIISHSGSIGSWLSATAQFRLDRVYLNLFSNSNYPTW